MTYLPTSNPIKLFTLWRQWPYKGQTIIALLVAIIILIILIVASRKNNDQTISLPQNQLPQVKVSQVKDLQNQTIITETGLLEAEFSAPLIARNGGRVTALNATLGDMVVSGRTIVAIDGANTGNPVQAQIAGLKNSLAATTNVKSNALKSADAAITIAQLQLDAAVTNRPFTQEQVAIARRNADVAVLSAQLAFDDAQDLAQDTVIRTADLALKQAGYAQDQTTLAIQQTNKQTTASIEQAEANLTNSQIARERIKAEIDSQIAQINTQLSTAQAQLQQQQVTAPISGQISRLSVSIGDYLNPGQQVGEITGNHGGRITLNTSNAVQSSLFIGQIVSIKNSITTFSGTIKQLSSLPNSQTGLYQVEITITQLPENIAPNSTVEVLLPVTRNNGQTYIPLDALNITENGPIVFTVKPDNYTQAIPVNIQAYDGDYVAIQSDMISLDTNIVISGNRVLRDNTEVSITK
jgi:RND family efflux transporter MFP subunit